MVHYEDDFRRRIREKIIHILKSNPQYFFTQLELVEISNASYNTVQRIVSELEKEDMVVVKNRYKNTYLDGAKRKKEKKFIKWNGYL